MAEGILLFGVLLAAWSILHAHQSPWLAGIGLAIAFNAKHSALALLPAAVLGLVWLPSGVRDRSKVALLNLVQFGMVFLMITVALNPVFWEHPLMAARSAVQIRGELAAQQIQDNLEVAPEKVSVTPLQRFFVMLLNLYISPPEYGLIENLHPTLNDLEAYLAVPGHNLFRGIAWGGTFFVLTLFGLYMAVLKAARRPVEVHRDLVMVLLVTVCIAAGLLAAIQISWIRYTVPLVPFICIWIAYGVTALFKRRSAG
jgi:4-amino-4-deoxy-L-arabinose transferase-like glycosyltransferase